MFAHSASVAGGAAKSVLCGVQLGSVTLDSKLTDYNDMDVKLILLALTPVFIVACLFFGTRNGFYDTDNYHGNGSAH